MRTFKGDWRAYRLSLKGESWAVQLGAGAREFVAAGIQARNVGSRRRENLAAETLRETEGRRFSLTF